MRKVFSRSPANQLSEHDNINGTYAVATTTLLCPILASSQHPLRITVAYGISVEIFANIVGTPQTSVVFILNLKQCHLCLRQSPVTKVDYDSFRFAFPRFLFRAKYQQTADPI